MPPAYLSGDNVVMTVDNTDIILPLTTYVRKQLESIQHGFLFHKSHTGNLAPFARSDLCLAMVIQSDILLRLFHSSITSRSTMMRRFGNWVT